MKLKHVKELARQAGMNLEIRLTSGDGHRVATLESSSQMNMEAVLGEDIWNNKELRAVNALLDYIQGARSLPPQKVEVPVKELVYVDKPEAPANGEAAMEAIGYTLAYQNGLGENMEEARYAKLANGLVVQIYVTQNEAAGLLASKTINGKPAAFSAEENKAVGEVFREAGYGVKHICPLIAEEAKKEKDHDD